MVPGRAVGPHGECLIGLDWYTFFYSKGMGAFTGQSKSVLTYWENRGTADYSHMNGSMVYWD